MKRMKKDTLIAAMIAMLALFLPLPAGAQGGEGMAPPPAAPVVVEVMKKEPLRLWRSYSGRMEAVDYVELRAQVDGRIEEVKFGDGDRVKKGDVLFVIDPRPYKAGVDEAKAALAAAESQHDLAVRDLERAQSLIKTDTVSRRVLDERENAEKIAKNAIAAARAMLERAQIDLDRAYIKAPVSGRVSRAEVTVGNLVQVGPNAPVLTTIVSDEGIYADFDVDEQTYVREIRNGARDRETEGEIPVQIVLQDGSVREGHVESFDNRINASTGTIRARALFDNADGMLLPGMFVTVRLGGAAAADVMLVPEQAVGTDQDRKFVYIVDGESKSAYREVTLGDTVGTKRIVLSGLTPGDKVIAEGIMKVMPGMAVIPQEKTDGVKAVPEGAAQKAAEKKE